MKVELIKATRGVKESTNGLITFRIEVPIYIWTEILTHRRSVRNGSSARAMSTDRYASMGHYTPATFYAKGSGMQASNTPIKHQWLARIIWNTSFAVDVLAAKALEYLGVAKEQRNRVIAPYKYIAGMVTMTEDGWKHFLSLRTAQNADKAMQRVANTIAHTINDLNNPFCVNVLWEYSNFHIPYDPGVDAGDYHTRAMIAAAKISRLSYNRIEGKDDLVSAQRLLSDRHLSPFDHIAEFKASPNISALFCKRQDGYMGYVVNPNRYGWLQGHGWETYRSNQEPN